MWQKEQYIEIEICAWLMEEWAMVWDNEMRGFYNEKLWFYQRNNNNFVRPGISDVMALVQWRFIAIEVKKPSEMSFFDRTIEDLRERFAKAQYTTKKPKKYHHAVEQREFLDDVIKNWWTWFFASSIEQARERLEENWFIFT